MLTGMKVVIIGGDLRQLEVIRILGKLDATIYLIGYDQLDDGFLGVEKTSFEALKAENIDAIILPINGMKKNKEVDSVFSSSEVYVNESWLAKVRKNTKIYTGICNAELKELAGKAELNIITLMERDDLAIYNSIPTAEGALLLAIQHTNVTIHGSNVIVSGFGRVGQTIARVFEGLGANVKVIANEDALRARAYEMKLKPYPLSEFKNIVEDADTIINTIPARVITSEIISRMANDVLILDIASSPGGTDFEFAEKRAVHAILTPGLPGLVAPKTAGVQLGSLLSTLLQKQWEESEGGNV
ncbi:dipicolinic acid synthetase subunit A [Salipaludibacillus daqingensis]|uniref:dipicolinic acid synthetase subunit A n=1 Tax=Salipaludibacillus daqingensis TaxID=3041001 RepID=UPI00247510D2|nr:dipicolinic acid synthetase subunit A [Salipaludibacillus daqingensis]